MVETSRITIRAVDQQTQVRLKELSSIRNESLGSVVTRAILLLWCMEQMVQIGPKP